MTQLSILDFTTAQINDTPTPPVPTQGLIDWWKTQSAFYTETIAILAASRHPHREYEIRRLEDLRTEVLEKIGGAEG